MKRALVAALGVLLFASHAAAQLTPPPPIDPNSAGAPNAPPPAYTPTEQQLNQSEQKSSGRGLELLYVAAEGGFSYMNAGGDSSLGLSHTSGPGGMFGVAAGVRLIVLTLGARFRYNIVGPFDLAQINAVVGLHIPAGWWDPYVAVHGGYDFTTRVDASGDVVNNDDPSKVSLHGGNVGLSGGVDYYFVKLFSLGIDGTVEALFLARPQIDPPSGVAKTDPTIAANALYQQSGSSVGIGISASLHAALHF